METRCKATNASGQPCAAHVRDGDDYCRWHDPTRADDRREWRRKGGKGKSNLARLKKTWEADSEQLSASALCGLLSAAMLKVYAGELEPRVLSALSGGAKALLAVQQADQLEARLAALEAAVTNDRGRIA